MNPLLEKSKNFDEALDFDKIKNSHFIPALKHEILEAQKNITKIISNPPSFENTIKTLEISGSKISNIVSTFFNLLGANSSDEMIKITEEFSKIHTEFISGIFLNKQLFEKVFQVFKHKETLKGEDLKLLENTYKAFVRNGANLSEDKKEELRKIDIELALLNPKFSDNVLKAMTEFKLHVTNPKDVEGIPESTLSFAKKQAEEVERAVGQSGNLANGQSDNGSQIPDADTGSQISDLRPQVVGWLFGLDMPTYTSFMKYCGNRDLRFKMHRAFASLCVDGKYSTTSIIKKTISLRHKRAELLGFKSHAEYVLEDRMVKTSEKVNKFLDELLSYSKKPAEDDLQKLQKLFSKDYPNEKIKHWDISFYQEKLKLKEFDFSDEETRNYFELENVIEGMFGLAKRLYALEFQKISLPKYHSEVLTYKIYFQGKYMALFYLDLFPRPNKKTGAWMTTYREQGLEEGEIKRPHVAIVCNFTRPTDTKPSLITFRECEIMFHEFGHALHAILSECKYKSLSGTNVHWDFVELPSQFMENWLMEKQVLDEFAKHFESGEKFPTALFEKMKRAKTFMAGLNNLRQINFSILDMAWHSGYIDEKNLDIESFEKKHSVSLLPHEEGTSRSHSFAHIFAGGYSAGYYSYKWAEVLDADAFECFKENGLFNRKIAESFKNILKKGATEEPEILYRKFRGRNADIKALLRRYGIDKNH